MQVDRYGYGDTGEWEEEWLCDPPAVGTRYVVIEDEWNEDFTVRTIKRIESQVMTTTVPMQAVAEIDATPNPTDDRLTSVTSVLTSYGDREALIGWAANETGKAAVTRRRTWQAIAEEDGDDAAIAWLAKQRFNPPRGERSATKLGRAVHAAVEYLVVNGHRPALGHDLGEGVMDTEVAPYVDSFDMWLEWFQPEFTAAEMTVYNTTYGYAGTLDAMATIHGQKVVIDYKTSKQSTDGRGKRKGPWSDVSLQVCAYRHAEFAAVWRARKVEEGRSGRYYLLSPEERELAVPMPASDGALCVHITPQHCDTYPLETDVDSEGVDVFERFLYCIENHRTTQMASRWIGEPLMLLDRKAQVA